MSRNLTRAVIIFIVLLFVATAMVPLLQVWQDHNAKKASNNQGATVNNKPVLQGTKLAGFTPVASISQLQAIDTAPGTGATVKASDTITVDYTGALASTGVIFESSKDSGQPVTFPLSQVIPGWTQGIPGMKEGGTRRLLIPAKLAYGAAGKGSIPANADLVFDVALRSISK